MTAAEQQQQFENTRARIQRNLNEITEYFAYVPESARSISRTFSSSSSTRCPRRAGRCGFNVRMRLAALRRSVLLPRSMRKIRRSVGPSTDCWSRQPRPGARTLSRRLSKPRLRARWQTRRPFRTSYAPISDDKNLLVLQVWLRRREIRGRIMTSPRFSHPGRATRWSS